MYEGIKNEYFDWLCGIVTDNRYGNSSYDELLNYLFEREFLFSITNDRNRALDGIELRYRFGISKGYDRVATKEMLNIALGNCRVLEMMIALSLRIEEQVMTDYDYQYGDRTSKWFWDMIINLGLNDIKFNKNKTEKIVNRFINREYESNGNGGLFLLNDAKYDLREEEIWYQAMWSLDENYKFSL